MKNTLCITLRYKGQSNNFYPCAYLTVNDGDILIGYADAEGGTHEITVKRGSLSSFEVSFIQPQ